MKKLPKNHKAVEYYAPKRKRRVSGSTVATSKFLALVHLDYPEATINELKTLLTDKTKFVLMPEAIRVLDDHIQAGYGNSVPNWRY